MNAGDRRRLAISVVISTVAIGIAIVHVAYPDAQIDAITIALLAVASVPWLAPLLKSMELPGGLKLEFRELQARVEHELRENAREVHTIAKRVEELAEFTISGSAPRSEKEKLATALAGFREHLMALGIDLSDDEPPSVEIVESYPNAHYAPTTNNIVCGEQFAYEDVLFREYAHHALLRARGRGALDDGVQDAVESGVGDFLTCSYRDDPELGRDVATYLRSRHGFDREALRDLRSRRVADPEEVNPSLEDHKPGSSPQDAGEVWGAAFWELRDQLGVNSAEQSIVDGWSVCPAGGDSPSKFVERVAEASGGGDSVLRAFARRQLVYA